MFKQQPNLVFWIDVSGMPFETTYVGLIVSTPPKISKAVKELNKSCPRIFSKKAHKIDKEELLKVLSVLDSCDIMMFTTKFPSWLWEDYKKEFGGRKVFKEKMMAFIYYKLMISKQKIFSNFPYQVITCEESHLDIHSIHKNCLMLGISDKRKFSFSTSTGDYNEGIRLADYVAHSLKSQRMEKLKQLKNLNFIKIERDNRLFEKLFD
ncbi:MAG TPA: hypothetical protein PLI99_01090 [archaeon]|nr:hypothetical protein [archaeon]